ncbi:MAG: hypothetical protein J5954_02225 [Prevotella sp.]|nr:hypothetical protein [Prevotella sp.]MBP3789528.1 hypothetical protein [Prevotella sp.]
MGKRSKGELENTKYFVKGKEVDINQYLAPKSPLPQIPDACHKYVAMSFDDMTNIMPHESIDIVNEYSKPTFESTMTKEQIAILLPVLNQYIFVDELSENDVEAWLRCEGEPMRVITNRNLAYLLNKMAENDLICSNWAQVAGDNRIFKSKNGKTITSSNLTTSLNRFSPVISRGEKGDSKRVIRIKEAIEAAVKSAKG